MKNILILTLLSFTIIQAQPNIDWQKSFGGSESDEAYCISQTKDGGYIIVGTTYSNDGDVSNNYGYLDILVIKLDSNGALSWKKSLGDTIIESASSIQQTIDGGYIMCGYTSADDLNGIPKKGTSDLLIIKLTSNGTLSWQKSLGGSNSELGGIIQQTKDGGYIVGASSKSKDGDASSNKGDYDYWMLKLNHLGNIEWQKSYGGSASDRLNSIQVTKDGGYIAAGTSSSNDFDVTGNHGQVDFWIVKIDKNGNLQWQKSIGGSKSEYPYSIKQTFDNGYIVAGTTHSKDGDASVNTEIISIFVLHLDSSGAIIWAKSFGGTSIDEARSIEITKDSGIIITGYTTSIDGDVAGHHNTDGNYDIWILKLNKTGDIEWQKCLGGNEMDLAFFIIQTFDGGYAIAGSSSSTDGDLTSNKGKTDFWIIKLSNKTVGLNDLVKKYNFSVYPNPSNNVFNFKNNESLIGAKYAVVNALGQTLLEAQINNTTTLIELEAIPSGIYFLQIHTDNGVLFYKLLKNNFD